MYQSVVDQWGNVIFIKNNFYLSVSNVQLGPRSSRKLDGSIPKRGSKKGSRNILRNQIQFACTTSRKIYQKHEIIAKFTSSWKSNLNLKIFIRIFWRIGAHHSSDLFRFSQYPVFFYLYLSKILSSPESGRYLLKKCNIL